MKRKTSANALISPWRPFISPWRGRATAVKLPPSAKARELDAEQSARFLRIASQGALVRRHFEIFRWLNGELQQFLPHEILIAAWGDFEQRSLKFDITSGLPGVRTARLAQCPIDDIVRKAHALWLQAGRQPLLLRSEEALERHACRCPMHAALRVMRAVLVHGMRDQRSGNDSLYLALSAGSLTRGRSRQRLLSLVDALVAQIDGAFRRIAALPLPVPALTVPLGDDDGRLELSEREREILESVCQGNTNIDIAGALGISPFTVKNHMQRIFRKIGVNNRMQAARHFDAMRHAAVSLAPEGAGAGPALSQQAPYASRRRDASLHAIEESR